MKQNINNKLNCWEYFKCGIQTCPSYLAIETDGINGGIHGGRICWAVAGSLCSIKRESVQGKYAKYINDCIKCGFFLMVKNQECGGKFTMFVEVDKTIHNKGT